MQAAISGQPYQSCGSSIQYIRVKKIYIIGNFLQPFWLKIIQEAANQRILYRYSILAKGKTGLFAATRVMALFAIINYPKESSAH
jgi:hypothetical protein